MKKHDTNRYSAWWALALVLCCLWACAAIPSGAVWEIRAAVMTSAQYGGFYSPEDAAGGGLDYSQQDNPQYECTTAMTWGGPPYEVLVLPDALDLTYLGNGLYLSGTGATAGWYCITQVSVNLVYLDRSCAAAPVANLTIRIGGAIAYKDATFEAMVAGNTVHIKADATHAQPAAVAIATGLGTTALPITVYGYHTTRGDNPTGTDRPLISGGASYRTTFGSYYRVHNLRFTQSSTTATVTSGTGTMLENCYTANTRSDGGAAPALTLGTGAIAINCQAVSTDNYGICVSMGADSQAIGCYAYDGSAGYQATAATSTVAFSIADACLYGVYYSAAGSDYGRVFGSTIYSTIADAYGVYAVTTAIGNSVYNSIIMLTGGGTTGISAADASLGCIYEDYNNIYGCANDRIFVTTGPHSFDLDPGFVDAANGDFRVGVTCKAKGFPGAIPGAAATCIGYLDSGAVQRIEPTAGSGGTRATGGVW